MRSLVSGPRRRGQVITAFPAACYVELRAPGPEPCTPALVIPAVVALPIAVIARRAVGHGAARDCSLQPARAGETSCLDGLTAGDAAVVGIGVIETSLLRVAVCRWRGSGLGPRGRMRCRARTARLSSAPR